MAGGEDWWEVVGDGAEPRATHSQPVQLRKAVKSGLERLQNLTQLVKAGKERERHPAVMAGLLLEEKTINYGCAWRIT